ncbi:hypothetical protein SAMN05660772_00998 [Pasteurella testudinis DSM 23072]|uniref:Uncharacterized protein n=1 Tax=Pasteurella testudinis DSM 23072 TaxID=1122938 RepID=A0A1W1V2I4_9PAST|nr:hypothetical protein SAMN05660772_00998 [Pasteurella testudinis DSM 23072]SUB50521.1 Uncharacterised protein [Pasteurella testudinis]
MGLFFKLLRKYDEIKIRSRVCPNLDTPKSAKQGGDYGEGERATTKMSQVSPLLALYGFEV